MDDAILLLADFREDALHITAFLLQTNVFQFQIELKDLADSPGFILVNDDLFVVDVIAKRDTSASYSPIYHPPRPNPDSRVRSTDELTLVKLDHLGSIESGNTSNDAKKGQFAGKFLGGTD